MSTTGRNPSPERGAGRGDPVAAARRALDAAGLPAGAKVLAAVSGGPDSTALLAILADLRDRGRLRLAACVVDHGIRPAREVAADVAFLRSLCARLAVPLAVERLPAGECRARARASKRSLEEVAREARLAALASRARRLGARAVALGHTEDDSLETVLMGVLRGSDAAGLRGIPPARGPFVRPLLSCSRTGLRALLCARSLGFRSDPTNDDPAMLRNRVRGSLLPVLEREFPGWRRGLASLARKSSRTAEMLRETSAAMGWQRTAAGFRLAAEEFFGFPAALRAASLMRLWDSFSRGRVPRRLPSRFLVPALGARPASAGRTTLLAGHGARLRLEGESVFWEADVASSAKKSYLREANGPGSFEIRSAGIVVRIAREGPRMTPAIAAADARILEHEVAPPLVLRSRRAGDRVRLAHGAKTLKALLAEMKVPSGDRWMVPILADRKGVLAVLGGMAGCRTVVRRGAAAPRDGDPALAVWAEGQEGTSEQQF